MEVLRRREGFTLLEVLTVVAIVAVLAGVAVLSFSSFSDSADEEIILGVCRTIENLRNNSILTNSLSDFTTQANSPSYAAVSNVGSYENEKMYDLEGGWVFDSGSTIRFAKNGVPYQTQTISMRKKDGKKAYISVDVSTGNVEYWFGE